MSEKIGEFLVRIGAMTEKQCEEIILIQQSGDKRYFGEIAVEKGFVNKDILKKYLHAD
jgi:hypothetical protein